MKDSNEFVVKHKALDAKKETTETITVRIDKDLVWEYDALAYNSGRSRNEVIKMALKYAIEHLKLINKSDEG